MPKENPDADGMVAVLLPSGATYQVYEDEVFWFKDKCGRYLKDNIFTNVSDLQDLDRVLMTELLVWRWQIWLSQKRDYWGEPIDENAIQKAAKDHSAELRQLKKSLGMDKTTRDVEKGEGSVSHYLEQLRVRAKSFGYMRNEQAAKAIELFQQLKALLTFYENCDDMERRQQKITLEDLLSWIKDVAVPEFDEIDAKFRETDQQYWIRDQ